eukprot:jgi/Mesvir1/23478/Mv22327-RA.1
MTSDNCVGCCNRDGGCSHPDMSCSCSATSSQCCIHGATPASSPDHPMSKRSLSRSRVVKKAKAKPKARQAAPCCQNQGNGTHVVLVPIGGGGSREPKETAKVVRKPPKKPAAGTAGTPRAGASTPTAGSGLGSGPVPPHWYGMPYCSRVAACEKVAFNDANFRDLRATNAALVDELARLQEALAQDTAELRERALVAEAEVGAGQERVAAAREQLRGEAAARERDRACLEELTNRFKEEERLHRDCQVAKAAAESKASLLAQRLEDCQGNLANVTQQCQLAQGELATVKGELQAEKRIMWKALKERDHVLSAVESLQRDLTLAEAELSSKAQQLNQLQGCHAQMEELKRKHASLEAVMRSLTERNQQLDVACQLKARECEDAQRDAAAAAAQVKELEKRICEPSCAACGSRRGCSATCEACQCQGMAGAHTQECASLRKEVQSLQDALARKDGEIVCHAAEASRLQAESSRLQAALEGERRRATEAEAAAMEASRSAHDCLAEMWAARKELDALMALLPPGGGDARNINSGTGRPGGYPSAFAFLSDSSMSTNNSGSGSGSYHEGDSTHGQSRRTSSSGAGGHLPDGGAPPMGWAGGGAAPLAGAGTDPGRQAGPPWSGSRGHAQVRPQEAMVGGLMAVNRYIHRCLEDLAATRQALADKEGTLSVVQHSYASLQASLAEAKEAHAALEQRVEEKVNELMLAAGMEEQLQQQLAACQAQVASDVEEIAHLRKRSAEMEAAAAEAKESLAALQASAHMGQQQASSAQAVAANAEQTVRRLEEEVAFLRTHLADKEADVQTLHARLEEHRGRHEESLRTLEATHAAQLRDKTAMMSDIVTAMQAEERAKLAAIAETKSCRKQLSATEGRVAKLEGYVEKLMEMRRRAEEEAHGATLSAHALQNKVATLRKENKAMLRVFDKWLQVLTSFRDGQPYGNELGVDEVDQLVSQLESTIRTSASSQDDDAASPRGHRSNGR